MYIKIQETSCASQHKIKWGRRKDVANRRQSTLCTLPEIKTQLRSLCSRVEMTGQWRRNQQVRNRIPPPSGTISSPRLSWLPFLTVFFPPWCSFVTDLFLVSTHLLKWTPYPVSRRWTLALLHVTDLIQSSALHITLSVTRGHFWAKSQD